MAIRLIEAGTVSALRSQTIYHGLSYARTADTPPTIVTVTPGEPYVCIGYHQDLELEIDVEFCAAEGLPVLRRETGGGVVLLDSHQLFVQWVMDGASLPPRVEQRFAMFAKPLVATYREFGIDADFRPVNDVHVSGRKIAGTGAARIGNAEVLVGNFIFDFDTDVMTRVLRVPSAAFRDQVSKSLRQYMTSIRRERGDVPDQQAVAAVYRTYCAEVFGQDLEPGELTDAERTAIADVDRRFSALEFQRQPGGLQRPGVKIHEDVYVVESSVGDRRVTARLRSGRLEDLELFGPGGSEEQADDLAALLAGIELEAETVQRVVDGHFRGRSDAAQAAEWLAAILSLEPKYPHQPTT